MRVTAWGLASVTLGLAWWVGGLGFVCLELIVHLVLMGRGRHSFYDGLG
jgi:hypothetical protein